MNHTKNNQFRWGVIAIAIAIILLVVFAYVETGGAEDWTLVNVVTWEENDLVYMVRTWRLGEPGPFFEQLPGTDCDPLPPEADFCGDQWRVYKVVEGPYPPPYPASLRGTPPPKKTATPTNTNTPIATSTPTNAPITPTSPPETVVPTVTPTPTVIHYRYMPIHAYTDPTTCQTPACWPYLRSE